MLIILCIFLMKLYPKRNMVLNGFNKTRLYGDNKIQGTFTKQKIQCFVVGDGSYFTHETFSFTRATHLWKYKKQIMVHSWNKFLIYQKKKKNKDFLYTEKHGAFCDINFGWPIVHFKSWPQKGDVVFIFKDFHVFIICTLHSLCLYPMSRESSNF